MIKRKKYLGRYVKWLTSLFEIRKKCFKNHIFHSDCYLLSIVISLKNQKREIERSFKSMLLFILIHSRESAEFGPSVTLH